MGAACGPERKQSCRILSAIVLLAICHAEFRHRLSSFSSVAAEPALPSFAPVLRAF